MHETVLEAEDLDSLLLVGRNQEIQLFVNSLEDPVHSKRVLNVYGTAGIGKSSLLDEFQRLARKRGVMTIFIDSQKFVQTPSSFCLHILQALQHFESFPEDNPSLLLETCVKTLNEHAQHQQITLFLDTYETMESMDHWLREYFFKQLAKNILIVIAGRYPLSEPWLLSPTWRQQMVRLPLNELDYAAVEKYARYCHIFDESLIQRMWRHSKGHPLTLSLVAFTVQQSTQLEPDLPKSDYDTLPYIVSQWLREVPGEHLRPLVEAASILRHFNQETISFVLGHDITASEFYQLIRFSFVRKVEQSWAVHSLMRDMVVQELQARTPQRYEEMRIRALMYYYEKIANDPTNPLATHDVYDLMYFIGDGLIRALINWFVLSPTHFETLDPSHLDQLHSYVQKRHWEAKDKKLELFDSHTNQFFDFYLSEEEACYTLKWLDFERLFALGYDVVKGLRDTAGTIIGIAIIIPINRKTIPYLEEMPRSSAYFKKMPAEQLKRMAVPENTRSGWFIETIDTVDLGDAMQQSAIAYLFHQLVSTGEQIVESPPPFPFFIDGVESIGFEIAPHGTHTNYDGVTPTHTYVLDTKGSKGNHLGYLNKVLQKAGLHNLVKETANPDNDSETETISPILLRDDLTPREKEVAFCLSEGLTNAEIASRLYVSEVTVKKHFKSMFEKLNVSNRTQLLKKLMEQ